MFSTTEILENPRNIDPKNPLQEKVNITEDQKGFIYSNDSKYQYNKSLKSIFNYEYILRYIQDERILYNKYEVDISILSYFFYKNGQNITEHQIQSVFNYILYNTSDIMYVNYIVEYDRHNKEYIESKRIQDSSIHYFDKLLLLCKEYNRKDIFIKIFNDIVSNESLYNIINISKHLLDVYNYFNHKWRDQYGSTLDIIKASMSI